MFCVLDTFEDDPSVKLVKFYKAQPKHASWQLLFTQLLYYLSLNVNGSKCLEVLFLFIEIKQSNLSSLLTLKKCRVPLLYDILL